MSAKDAMVRARLLTVGAVAVASAVWASAFAASAQPSGADILSSGQFTRGALDAYCVSCHNERSKIGKDTGITLDSMDVDDVPRDAERWEKVVRRLRTGAMPPQGARRPDQATYERLISGLEAALDRAE